MSANATPTLATYAALQRAFDHFNATLFEGRLPHCLITLRSSSRTYGYMHARRFVSINGDNVDELGINPGYFAIQSIEEVMATLVHEMVHHWQNHFGSPSKSVPHNCQWSERMEASGLMPSHTGLPGGKRTGRTMSDYILPDGAFLSACRVLSDSGFMLPWLDCRVAAAPERMAMRRQELAASGLAAVVSEPPLAQAKAVGQEMMVIPPGIPDAPSRVRFICPQCGIRAWAAAGTLLFCGSCETPLNEASAS